ncbi:alpha 1,2-mannosyltransferase [Blastomyces dermatitidis ER-3]|uniref:Alpha 1,2-mannosyltransferase n=1 Tax=Ajellomyces dermatitidis (strain ER-3 / ATCC MYA-2586) TaxID=559297 RepID=A0ABP2EW03_AJEDR|nr:alpha 1,2-mannosyltransferase [Blastomyces dermatitidis ER-3]EEQ86655.1 alpha 1,2-mannosyltransferase [Blastomyces dermatitidis ER-3]
MARPLRALAAFCLLLLTYLSIHALRRSSDARIYILPSALETRSLQARQIEFWHALLPILRQNAPDCPPPRRDRQADAVGFNAAQPPPRPSLISMPEGDVLKMQQAHTRFLQQVIASPNLKPVVIPKSRGVVSTAGGKYLPVFISSLRMLRRTGSNLPVELFLKDRAEYESSICDDVIPSLNGRCVVLSDILSASPVRTGDDGDSANDTGDQKPLVEIAHYQLKIFAMLFSSFEEIVWLDADCFPLRKPEEHLDLNPFKLTGMVTWPDFWISTVSPLYYNISQQPIPSVGLRASSETGQILLSKKTHPITLLLAAYYNYYGPSHYFPLLSQGAPGEGDKETFLQAASAAGEPFYATSEAVTAIGHVKRKDGTDIAGSAMVQFDPSDEYRNYQLTLTNSHKKNNNNHNNNNHNHHSNNNKTSPRVSFIHANFPKFNPATVFDLAHETKPTYRPDGSDGRAWVVSRDTLARFGYDVERAYWEEILWVACELKGKFRSWEGKEGICERVQRYWGNVFGAEAEGVDVDGVMGLWGT